MKLEDTTAVVTGAGRGIGAAIARALAQAGARVVLSDLDASPLSDVTLDISTHNPGAAVVEIAANAGTTEGITAMLELAQASFGPVDLYVANAGIFGATGLGSEADWSRTLEVNVMGHIRAAELLIPQWLERGHGYFASTASAAGLLTQIGLAPYSVTKHAAVGFAEWLAITYGDRGIGVSCLCPMGVNTDILAGVTPGEDPVRDLAVNAVVSAAEVMDPNAVAEILLQAIREERFLVLPHPEVATMVQQKAADPDRWIAGMRRYQARLGQAG